ncbi:glycosyltransferase [Actinospica sp.]|jgi:UDP:flavonoid glycosyltransferase YjiC (YdhE family)|uniref:glycosyltransferase n=1 Tax=Actinospica sp. TaxID=1872142 RepID=UPI002C79D446|nr:glycosyltransferase [Actinospica sp.]HWG27594.1 glycosyltransferase [Actinospica sp.]
MRVLLSGTPAFGHLLPLLPLAREARAAGHEVALLTSGAMAEAVGPELPVLPAGPMPDVLFAEVARRTGGSNPATDPKPETVAEFFAGTRVDLSVADAMEAARAWKPDLIVAEACDFVGPLVAAELEVPWHLLAFGPAVPDEFVELMFQTVAPRYAERGLAPTPPSTFLDPCPPTLQAPGWQAPPNRIALRPEPHRVDGNAWQAPDFADGADRPVVLVTLGTVFTEVGLLVNILASLESLDVNIVATLGPFADPTAITVDHSRVRTVGFVPLEQLLDGITAVVSTGGAGTILATLSRGLPMVLLPQGADQAINAERVEATGAGVALAESGQVGPAVARLLREDSFRARAGVLADEIAAMESAADVVRRLAG